MYKGEYRWFLLVLVERVTEPELMCSYLQVKAYAEADFSDTDENIIKKLEAFLRNKGKKVDENTSIVDLGCGPGNIAQRIALKWPSAQILGIDGSEEMLKIARRRAALLADDFDLKGLSYLQTDISLIAKGLVKVPLADIVVSNSLLHHLHDPLVFWNAIKNVSSCGAIQYHRDLERPASSKEVLEMQRKYLPDSPFALRKDYIASLHAAFTVIEVREQIQTVGLNGLNVLKVDERYLEVAGTV